MMRPFFDISGKRTGITKKGSARKQGAGGCEACGLWTGCNSPKMEPTGKGGRGILVIAEAPGKEEDKKGVQLVGKSGRRLWEELDRLGIDLDDDCRKINAVNCRPKDNRTPTDREIAFCRHRVLAEIETFKPRVILALGGAAMKSLAQHRGSWDKGFPGIMTWQGACIPDQEFGCWIIPTWHPAFIERMEGHAIYESRWRRDLKKAVSMADKAAPKIIDYIGMCESIIAPELAVARLEQLYAELCADPDPFVVFDYETTGLKPHIEGHRIVCVSFCASGDRSIACMCNDETWPWIEKILRNPRICKGGHNSNKFEKIWTQVRGKSVRGGGFPIRRLGWDSMIAAHVLDNRAGITGLKFQSYVNFGVLGYDNVVGPYIKSSEKGGNAFNRIDEAPVRELLLYCAMDSLLEFHLAMKQIPMIAKDEGLTAGYNLLHEGALALADSEIRGIRIDLDYCKKQEEHLAQRIQYLRASILEYPEVKTWRKMMGDKFNINSPAQLARLLSKELKLDMEKETASGGVSVDKGVLEKIDLPFIKDLLQIRKLEKIKTTYLGGFQTEAPDGVLHPFFNLHSTVSFRSSSDRINFQNIPKHDSEAQKITRRALLTEPGYLWFEVDYSGIEVRIGCSYHKDPNMIRYVTDPTTDMHRDAATDVFILEQDEVTKPIRQGGKNGWVFPQFYGDYYGNCATALWQNWVQNPDRNKLKDGTTLVKHLARHGIKNFDRFVKHLKKVEEKFWGERFPVYYAWRQENYAEYLKRGYMRGHVGFIYSTIMSKNDVNNYGTQGSAFHSLLRSYIKINKRLKKERWKSYLMGQIHDSIDGGTPPEEINTLLPMIRTIMVDDLCKAYTWINVPMEIDIEISPLGKSWYELQTVAKRFESCACGLEWGYCARLDDGGIRWTCPVCDHIAIERK